MFKKIEGIDDLINSDGFLLRLVERTDIQNNQNNLYIEGRRDDEGRLTILCQINPETLLLYFNGRLRTKELFLIRCDEQYIIITHLENRKKDIQLVRYNDHVMETLENLSCGNSYYTDIDWRTYHDTDEVMRIVNSNWSIRAE